MRITGQVWSIERSWHREMEQEEREDVCETETTGSCVPEGMSKNQWKKMLKRKKYEEGRQEWKKRQREKEKEKKRKRREQGIVREPPPKKQKMSGESASPIRVAIELGYQDLMTDQDLRSLMKQCQRCYAANRRAVSPLQLYFTGFGGRFKERMEETVPGHVNWDVNLRSGDYVEEFGTENIVFLAAESPNVLTDLAPDKVYVIGGLVDHNHYKGHCYENALSKGVAHAQLPISEHIELKSRKVLTVNHVFEILVEFVQCKDWKLAFEQVIPLRKQATASGGHSPHSHTTSPGHQSPHSDNGPPHTTSPGHQSPHSDSGPPHTTSPGHQSPHSDSGPPHTTSPGHQSPHSENSPLHATSPGHQSPHSENSPLHATSPGHQSPHSENSPLHATSPCSNTHSPHTTLSDPKSPHSDNHPPQSKGSPPHNPSI